MDEGKDTFSKLRWQCRRGMLELDKVLLSFLEEDYVDLSLIEKQSFESLLKTDDQTLYTWIIGRKEPTDFLLAGILKKIRAKIWKG